MFEAFRFLQFASFKNIALFRLRRLRQPKYLLGAIAGFAYFYFFFWRRISGSGFSSQSHARGYTGGFPFAGVEAGDPAFVAIASAILFLVVALVWIFGRGPAALRFSEAEIAFLFPAPISRATLIHFRLAKMQIGTLVQAAALTWTMRAIARGGVVSHGSTWSHFIGWWIILCVFSFHTIGVSLLRTTLEGTSVGKSRFRIWITAGLFTVAIGVWSFVSRIDPPNDLDLVNSSAMVRYVGAILARFPISFILAPFRWTVAPYFAPTTLGLLKAAGPALLILFLHYLWIIRSTAPFEEASIALAQKRSERVAALRSGDLRRAHRTIKPGREPFRLSPNGSVAVAFLWKNLLGAGPAFRPRTLFWCAALISLILSWLAKQPNWDNLLIIIGTTAITFSMMVLFAGPQIARQDFRTDLVNVDILKSYPVAGWKIALGEILAPICILSGLQWLLMMIIGFGFTKQSGINLDSVILFRSIAFGLAVVVPFFYGLVLIIPNAMALLFPSWVQLGRDSRGIEVLGQRLILGFSQIFILAVAIVPAAVFAGATWFLTDWILGDIGAIALATTGVILILATEAGFSIWWLGYWFERFDSSNEVIR